MNSVPSQVQHPWRAVTRTVFAAVLASVPVIVDVIVGLGLGTTTVGAASLTILGTVTRVLAMPAVEDWLHDYMPWLAAMPKPAGEPETQTLPGP